MIRATTAMALAACALLAACGGDDGGTGTVTVRNDMSRRTPVPAMTASVTGAPTLQLTIGGTAQGVDYDTVKVAGHATLGGNLQLRFAGGYRPAAGTQFLVLTADGGISGRFTAVDAEGVGYTLAYGPNTVLVTIL